MRGRRRVGTAAGGAAVAFVLLGLHGAARAETGLRDAGSPAPAPLAATEPAPPRPNGFDADVAVRRLGVDTLGVQDVPVRSFDARASVRYSAADGWIAPYAGVGLGIQMVGERRGRAVDGPGVDVGSMDIGGGANAFLGVQMPFGHLVSMFAEWRAGLGVESSDTHRAWMSADELGVLSGFAGIQLSF